MSTSAGRSRRRTYSIGLAFRRFFLVQSRFIFRRRLGRMFRSRLRLMLNRRRTLGGGLRLMGRCGLRFRTSRWFGFRLRPNVTLFLGSTLSAGLSGRLSFMSYGLRLVGGWFRFRSRIAFRTWLRRMRGRFSLGSCVGFFSRSALRVRLGYGLRFTRSGLCLLTCTSLFTRGTFCARVRGRLRLMCSRLCFGPGVALGVSITFCTSLRGGPTRATLCSSTIRCNRFPRNHARAF